MWEETRPPYYDAVGNLHTFFRYLYQGEWHHVHYIRRPDGFTLIQ